jgi:hypothetical protein
VCEQCGVVESGQFTAAYQDCVAPIGVQTIVDQSFNALQDNSCIIVIGAPLSASCKDYMANGTMTLANTSVVALPTGHATLWAVYVGLDKVNNLVLLDVNDPANPVAIATMATPAPLSWMIGNPTGLALAMTDGKKALVKVGAANALTITLF